MCRWISSARQCFWLLHHGLCRHPPGHHVLPHPAQDGKTSSHETADGFLDSCGSTSAPVFYSVLQWGFTASQRTSSSHSSISALLAHCTTCFYQQEFFQYYTESNQSRPSADEENKMDLLKKGTQSLLSYSGVTEWLNHSHRGWGCGTQPEPSQGLVMVKEMGVPYLISSEFNFPFQCFPLMMASA